MSSICWWKQWAVLYGVVQSLLLIATLAGCIAGVTPFLIIQNRLIMFGVVIVMLIVIIVVIYLIATKPK